MPASGVRDALQSRAVDANAIQVPLGRRFLRRGEVNGLAGFINDRYLAHLPMATSELAYFAPLDVIEIEMTVSAAFARPEKPVAVAKEIGPLVHIDPVRIAFGENGPRTAGCGG